jgi:D-amino peptidase
MEGIPGTFNWEHEKADRSAVKRYFRHHVDCVLQGILSHAKSPLINEILIADSHSVGDNLDYEVTAIDERVSLISGNPRPCYMMPALNSGFDHVFLIGYHSGTGSLRGNMDHTYSNSRIHKISINGVPMTEAQINAAYAAYHNVPVTLVTGDETLKNTLLEQDCMPWVEYVATKDAVAKFAAKNYSQVWVDRLTLEAVTRVLDKDAKTLPLYTIPPDAVLRIEFHSTAMTDVACLMPGVKRLDGRVIEYQADDYAVLFEAIMALVTLASTATM